MEAHDAYAVLKKSGWPEWDEIPAEHRWYFGFTWESLIDDAIDEFEVFKRAKV